MARASIATQSALHFDLGFEVLTVPNALRKEGETAAAGLAVGTTGLEAQRAATATMPAPLVPGIVVAKRLTVAVGYGVRRRSAGPGAGLDRVRSSAGFRVRLISAGRAGTGCA